MESAIISKDIIHLSNEVVNFLMESTNGDLKMQMHFIQAYNQVCNQVSQGEVGYYKSNLQLRQYVRDNLIKRGLIFISPEDVEAVYVTQKALNDYPL
jgi:hypothetical protein